MKPVKTYTVDEAKKALEHYCAYQERCHRDVTDKLKQLNMIPEAQEQIILHLLQHQYLNEERFAKTYARSKFNQNKWGKNKIIQELKARDISTYIINIALQEIDNNDYETALIQLIKKKNNTVKAQNIFKRKQKLIQYLYAKGYETDLIYKHVNQIIS